MKKRALLVLSLLLLFLKGMDAQNLVPNPSFEMLGNLPIPPNPRNSFEYEPMSGFKPFQKNLMFWSAASKTTPDLRLFDRDSYERCRKRFDDCDKPKTGQVTVGIITAMKNTYTDSYREYLQIKLKKTLRPNVRTYAEVWVKKERQAKLVSNNIGLFFSYDQFMEETEEVVSRTPQINYDSIINSEKKGWVKVEGSFIFDKPLRYLTIGNFFNNEQTLLAKAPDYTGSPYTRPYAYYLIDDIRVWQEGDEPEEMVFNEQKVEKGEPIQLNNIHFKTASAVLEPSSVEELEKLYSFLTNNPEVIIDIRGHTDEVGGEEYNLSLSNDRARAVFDYLVGKDIAKERLNYKGFGEKKPIASNVSEEGRSLNRRVEFVVREETN